MECHERNKVLGNKTESSTWISNRNWWSAGALDVKICHFISLGHSRKRELFAIKFDRTHTAVKIIYNSFLLLLIYKNKERPIAGTNSIKFFYFEQIIKLKCWSRHLLPLSSFWSLRSRKHKKKIYSTPLAILKLIKCFTVNRKFTYFFSFTLIFFFLCGKLFYVLDAN